MQISVPLASALLGFLVSALAYPLEKSLKKYANSLAMHVTLLRGYKFTYRPLNSRSTLFTWQTAYETMFRILIYAPLLAFSVIAGFSIEGVSVQPTSPLRTVLYTACNGCEATVSHGNLIQARLALVSNRVTTRARLELWGGFIGDLARENAGILDSLRPAWDLVGEEKLLELNLTTVTAFQNRVTVRLVEKEITELGTDYKVTIEGRNTTDDHLRGEKVLKGSLISNEDTAVCQIGCSDESRSHITVINLIIGPVQPCPLALENWNEVDRSAFSVQIVSAHKSFDLFSTLQRAALNSMELCNSNVRTLGSELAFLNMRAVENVTVEVKSESKVVAQFRAMYFIGILAPIIVLLMVWGCVTTTGRMTMLGNAPVFESIVDVIRGTKSVGVLEMKIVDGARWLVIDGERDIRIEDVGNSSWEERDNAM